MFSNKAPSSLSSEVGKTMIEKSAVEGGKVVLSGGLAEKRFGNTHKPTKFL